MFSFPWRCVRTLFSFLFFHFQSYRFARMLVRLSMRFIERSPNYELSWMTWRLNVLKVTMIFVSFFRWIIFPMSKSFTFIHHRNMLLIELSSVNDSSRRKGIQFELIRLLQFLFLNLIFSVSPTKEIGVCTPFCVSNPIEWYISVGFIKLEEPVGM